jgi:hypothetical protein
MPYDQKCEDLAKIFLQDYPDLQGKVTELAQEIQDAIEDWLDANTPIEDEEYGPEDDYEG